MMLEKFIDRFLNGGARVFEAVRGELRPFRYHIHREFFERTDAVDVTARRWFSSEFLSEFVGPRFGGGRQAGGGEVMRPPSGAIVLILFQALSPCHRCVVELLAFRAAAFGTHRRLRLQPNDALGLEPLRPVIMATWVKAEGAG